MFRTVERLIAATLIASRWLMAPLYLGLIAALGIVIVEFYRELAHTVVGFGQMTPNMVNLAILKLVDIVLVGNLVVIMTAAGVQALASNAVAATVSPFSHRQTRLPAPGPDSNSVITSSPSFARSTPSKYA